MKWIVVSPRNRAVYRPVMWVGLLMDGSSVVIVRAHCSVRVRVFYIFLFRILQNNSVVQNVLDRAIATEYIKNNRETKTAKRVLYYFSAMAFFIRHVILFLLFLFSFIFRVAFGVCEPLKWQWIRSRNSGWDLDAYTHYIVHTHTHAHVLSAVQMCECDCIIANDFTFSFQFYRFSFGESKEKLRNRSLGIAVDSCFDFACACSMCAMCAMCSLCPFAFVSSTFLFSFSFDAKSSNQSISFAAALCSLPSAPPLSHYSCQ